MNNDKQNNQHMNLNNDNYNSILCDQGVLYNQQQNQFIQSSSLMKNTNSESIHNANNVDSILINSSNIVQEGFGNIVEGFHEEKDSRIEDTIKNMDGWMKREFKELKQLQSEYSSLQSEYNVLDEKFETKTRDYLSRTSRDNTYNGKTLRFKDGEIGYVTEKGYLRDFDSESYPEIGTKNNCSKRVIDTEITRGDFISSDSQKLGPKMRLNKSDIQTIRIYNKNNYLHISELELYDVNNNNLLIPKNQKEELSFYCKLGVKLNDFDSDSDEYRVFLTYNGKRVSEEISFKASTLPKIEEGPPLMDVGSDSSNKFYGVTKPSNYGKDKQGMRILYYTMSNCNGWSPSKYLAKTQHVGSINFNWGSDKIIDNYRDYIGLYIDGYIISPVSGTIKLHSDSDDGQGFWWNDAKLWDGLNLNHGRSDAGRYFANVEVVKGQYYKFAHLWRECGGGANVRLFWTLPGKDKEIIPPQYFTIGGASGDVKRGVISQTFTSVKSVVNGFEVNTNGKKLVFDKRIETWIKPRTASWWSKQSQYFDSNSDNYGVMKVSNDVKVSLPPHNPFVESVTMNTGIGWSGNLHYPIDGVITQKWPNAVHSKKNSNVIYDINLKSNTDIERIRIYNRLDCCHDRLNGAKLQLLDSNKKILKEYKLNGDQEQVFYLNNEARGTTCGNEGQNVKVTQIGDIGDAEYIGCYRDKSSRAMKWEGKRGSFEECKQYAIDNKSPYFALQASKSNRDYHACMISDDLKETTKYGRRDERCPTRPYSDSYGPVGSGWTNAVYSIDGTNYNKINEKTKNITDTIDTYMGKDLAHCMYECEQTGECNAIEYDPDFETKIGKDDLYVGRNYGTRPVRADKNVDAYFDLDGFEIITIVKVKKNDGSWRNIFHYGNNNGERAPAMWLHPNFTDNWKIHFRIRTNKNTNDGINFRIPTNLRKLNKTLQIRMVIETTENVKIKAYVNEALVSEKTLSGEFQRLKDRRFYIKDPWYNRSGYVVKSVVLKDAFGTLEKGKCELKTGQDITQAPETTSIVYNKVAERPFVHGKENLGKVGYVDEKGVLHEYPQNMITLQNEYLSKQNVDSPGNDLFSRETDSIEKAISIANSRKDVAGFVRLPSGQTWFKNRNMYPVDPNGPQRYYNSMQLHYKQSNFKNNNTCTSKFSEINSFEWNNYTKGRDMTMKTKCTISNYADKDFNKKERLSTRLNVLNQGIKEKISRIKDRNSRLNPYLEKSNKRIGEIVNETQNNNNTRNELLANNQEGMTDMKDAYHTNVSSNLQSYQEEADSGSALLGLLGITGLIMGFSYMKK